MFKKVFYDRIDTARERYKSLSTDRARAYLVHGQPSELQVVDICELLQPMEIWTYRNLKGFTREAPGAGAAGVHHGHHDVHQGQHWPMGVPEHDDLRVGILRLQLLGGGRAELIAMGDHDGEAV